MQDRVDGRAFDQVRPITISYDMSGNADGSVLYSLGNTKVLCTVKLQDGVPRFLKGSGTGWLTAEYAMLPGSTQTRTQREASTMRRNNRSIEISRLIGRSLRAVLDLSKIRERTIYVDCDVIQADGGTRTAAISGAYCAMIRAISCWIDSGIIKETMLTDSLGAVSVGWKDTQALLDVNYQEDVSVDADFNFVLTGSGQVVEVQGASESKPLSWQSVNIMQELAVKGVAQMLAAVPVAYSAPLLVSEKSQVQL